MRKDRRKTGDVIWLALQYAKQDRKSLVDAYRGNESEPVVKAALADIRAFERLQMRLFGASKSELEAKMGRMKSVSIFDLRKILDELDEAQ